jgi:hypothetical protein
VRITRGRARRVFTALSVTLGALALPVVNGAGSASPAGALMTTEPKSVIAEPLTQVRNAGVDEAVVTIHVTDGGGPAANAPINISRSGANPAPTATFVTNAVGTYVHRYTGQNLGVDVINVATTDGSAFHVTVEWVQTTFSATHPSEDCTSGTIVRGYIGNTHLNLRTQLNPMNANQLWVCAAAQVPNLHVGGKIVVTTNTSPGAVPPVVAVDDTKTDAEACRPIGKTVLSGDVGSEDFFFVDVAANPNGRLGAWVCVKFDGIYRRIRVTSETPVTVAVVLDPASSVSYPEAGVAGPWSGTCKANGGQRYVNLVLVGGSRVSLYTWSQPDPPLGAKHHVCVAAGPVGGRLTVDDDETPTLGGGNNLDSSCPFKVGVDEPAQAHLYTVDPENPTFPAGVCVHVGDVIQRVTVHSADDQPVQFRFDSDPA